MDLDLYFNLFEYIYNNFYFYYYMYVTMYKLRLYIGFYFYYWNNLLLYYIQSNKILACIFGPIIRSNIYFRNLFLWFNRRFLKKRKRFRIYYRFHNVRYWKFLLFLLYINAFILIWRRRNLYRKSQLVLTLVFLHIFVLISSHFFISIFSSFDIAVLFCLLFSLVIMLLFNR